MANAQDVAAFIIERLGPIDHMKLQKLLYYGQGWSIAWRDTPLFPEPIEAWRYGPVVDSVYQVYKDHGHEVIHAPAEGNRDALNADEAETVEAVVRRYQALSGVALSDLTHEDDAWLEAWERRGARERGRQVIPPPRIAESLESLGPPHRRHTTQVDDALLQAVVDGDADALRGLFSGDEWEVTLTPR